MIHWLILPIVLPAFIAPFIVLAARYQIGIQRVISVASMVALIGIALGLSWSASDGSILLYQLGDWAAPFGIVLVGDRLSTMMVLLAAVLALFVLLYAIGSKWDERGRHFHALFQFPYAQPRQAGLEFLRVALRIRVWFHLVPPVGGLPCLVNRRGIATEIPRITVMFILFFHKYLLGIQSRGHRIKRPRPGTGGAEMSDSGDMVISRPGSPPCSRYTYAG